MRRFLKLVWQAATAVSTLAWILSIAPAAVVTSFLAVLLDFPMPWAVTFWAGITVTLGALLLPVGQRFAAQLVALGPTQDSQSGGIPTRLLLEPLLNHRLSVLQAEWRRLHTSFTEARDGTRDPDAVEQVYQLRLEPIIRWELVDHPELLNLYFDDTGFNQPTYAGPPKRTEVANFLERRSIRLKEVIAELRKMRDGQ